MMRFEQPVGNMDWESGSIPIRWAAKAHGGSSLTEAIRDDWLPKLLVCIHDDGRSIEQPWLGDMRDRTATSVGAQDGISERCLVQSL
jgi:hypothetical protein